MNQTTVTFVCLCLFSAAMIGCDKGTDTAPATKVEQAVKSAGDAAAQKASDVASAVTTEAQKYLDQVNQFIKENKLNEADAVLTKLEALKDKLPAEWAAKINSAKEMLAKAKSALGGGAPAPLPAPAQ
jgi:hypothetical protein